MLIEKKKFDFRLYLLLKGVNKFEAFLSFDGLVRLCTEDYKHPSSGQIHEKDILSHLTNYSLNKNNPKFKVSEEEDLGDGYKRKTEAIFKLLESQGIQTEKLKADIWDICIKTVISIQPHLINMFHIEMGVGNSNKNVFHIFGIDILIDTDGKPWLMEINASPSLSMYQGKESDKKISKIDQEVKSRILSDTIKIIWGDYDSGLSTFERIYESNDNPNLFKTAKEDGYEQFRPLNLCRIIFELIAGYKRPEFINMS